LNLEKKLYIWFRNGEKNNRCSKSSEHAAGCWLLYLDTN
jgi:hypothetical protein